MALTIAELRRANPRWFASGNARFFADFEYRVLHSKQGNPYLVRRTYAYTDMFGSERIAHYRINPIGDSLDILSLDDRCFATLADVKQALKSIELHN